VVVPVSEAGYLRDKSHLFVAAPTGSKTVYGGKSTLATWICDTHGRASKDLVLFVNVKLDDAPERAADAVAQDVEEVGRAFGDGAKFVTLSPMNPDWEEVSRRVQAFIRSLPTDTDKMVVLDEVPELDEDAVLWFVRVAGNGNNCKSVGIAQNPGDVSTSIRGQCILIWVGPAGGNNRAVLEAADRGAHYEHLTNQDPYHWSVLLGPEESDREEFKPVPEKYVT
jgi:hypothetical protein